MKIEETGNQSSYKLIVNDEEQFSVWLTDSRQSRGLCCKDQNKQESLPESKKPAKTRDPIVVTIIGTQRGC